MILRICTSIYLSIIFFFVIHVIQALSRTAMERTRGNNGKTKTRCCPRRDPFNMQTINRSTHPLTNRFHFLFDERTRAASILRIFIAQRLLTSDPTKITIQTTFQQFSTAHSILSPLENFQLGRSNVFPRFPGKRIP